MIYKYITIDRSQQFIISSKLYYISKKISFASRRFLEKRCKIQSSSYTYIKHTHLILLFVICLRISLQNYILNMEANASSRHTYNLSSMKHVKFCVLYQVSTVSFQTYVKVQIETIKVDTIQSVRINIISALTYFMPHRNAELSPPPCYVGKPRICRVISCKII